VGVTRLRKVLGKKVTYCVFT